MAAMSGALLKTGRINGRNLLAPPQPPPPPPPPRTQLQFLHNTPTNFNKKRLLLCNPTPPPPKLWRSVDEDVEMLIFELMEGIGKASHWLYLLIAKYNQNLEIRIAEKIKSLERNAEKPGGAISPWVARLLKLKINSSSPMEKPIEITMEKKVVFEKIGGGEFEHNEVRATRPEELQVQDTSLASSQARNEAEAAVDHDEAEKDHALEDLIGILNPISV